MKGIRETPTGLWIGAGTTHRQLLDDRMICRDFTVLAQALPVLGSPPIRNMGTIGGNLCTASLAGDTLPPLYVLGAKLELSAHSHRRNVPIAAFILGPGKTGLHPGEILTGIRLDRPDGYSIQHYEKVGQRKALACAIGSMAALLKMSPAEVIESARLAWGSVGPTVIASAEVEQALVGKRLSPRPSRKYGLPCAAGRVSHRRPPSVGTLPAPGLRQSAVASRSRFTRPLTQLRGHGPG